MQFTKSMIDLAKEIRRHAPSDVKPNIKMANPDLFSELTTIFHSSNDAVIKALIKEICELAGDPWPQKLRENSASTAMTVKVYRGQTQLVEKKPATQSSQKKATTRIYRGQVISN